MQQHKPSAIPTFAVTLPALIVLDLINCQQKNREIEEKEKKAEMGKCQDKQQVVAFLFKALQKLRPGASKC